MWPASVIPAAGSDPSSEINGADRSAKKAPKMKPLAALLFAFSLSFSSAAQAARLLIGFRQVTLQSLFYVELQEGAEAAGGDQLIF